MKIYVCILLIIISLLRMSPASAQGFVSGNHDEATIAAMGAAFAANQKIEADVKDIANKILKSYTRITVSATGIFTAKQLERKAKSKLGLFGSEENKYYKAIRGLVKDNIIPNIFNAVKKMIKSPTTALHWGNYMLRICQQVQDHCMQFESIVTNSKLSFSDIEFPKFKEEFENLINIVEMEGANIKEQIDILISLKDSLGNDIRDNINIENFKGDVTNLVDIMKNIKDDGWDGIKGIVTGSMNNVSFAGNIKKKFKAGKQLVHNVDSIYKKIYDAGNIKNTIDNILGNTGDISRLMDISEYNMTKWVSKYDKPLKNEYYSQMWYIMKERKARRTVVCDYKPPQSDWDALNDSKTWSQASYTAKTFEELPADFLKRLQEDADRKTDAESGWSVAAVNRLNEQAAMNPKLPKYYWNREEYRRIFPYTGRPDMKLWNIFCISWSMWVEKREPAESTVYDEIPFNSQKQDLASFVRELEIKVEALNKTLNDAVPEDGFEADENLYVYKLVEGEKQYYEACDEDLIESSSSVTISVTCHGENELISGSGQYKCRKCDGTLCDHVKTTDCSLKTSGEDYSIPQEDSLSMIDQIHQLEVEMNNIKMEISDLNKTLKGIEANYNKAVEMGDTAGAEEWKKQMDHLRKDINKKQSLLLEKTKLYQEALEGAKEMGEDYAPSQERHWRIPSIIRDCVNTYGMTFYGSGTWNDFQYVMKGKHHGLGLDVVFTCDPVIVRKPKRVLGILTHRTIVGLPWKVTAVYTDTHMACRIILDRNKTATELEKEVNDSIAAVAMAYPSCKLSVEYEKVDTIMPDDEDDTYHLVWASDRLDIARDIYWRLYDLNAELIALNKFLLYKYTLKDMLKNAIKLDWDQGRQTTLVDSIFNRWLETSRLKKPADSTDNDAGAYALPSAKRRRLPNSIWQYSDSPS